MEKVTITLTMEEEKLKALEIFLKKENTTVKKRMDEALRQLYESTVPEAVREYVGCKITVAARDRSRRPAPRPARETPAAEKIGEGGDSNGGGAVPDGEE